MQTTFKLKIGSSYGNLSRGRHSARRKSGSETVWAEKENGYLIITEPGVWYLHCSDGFQREARATLTVDEEGGWEMSGDIRRFNVV